MTPFQSINATIYMLIAKAREPNQDPALIPAVSRVAHQGSAPTDPPTMQLRRRSSDSPFHHESVFQRTWKVVAGWLSDRKG
jgi:hypothetical protein